MKRLSAFIFIVMVMSSFSSFAQQDGNNNLFGVPGIQLFESDSIVTSSVGRSMCYVPASEKLDGEELANIIVTDYGFGGRVHVFKQIHKNSLGFKLVWTSKSKSPNRSDYGPSSTPRSVIYGDLDGNGKKEIIFPLGHAPADTVLSDTKWPRGIHIYECVGPNDYGTDPYIIRLESIDPTTVNINWGRTEQGGLIAADIDNDGKQELLIGTLNMAYNDNLAYNNGKAWVVSLESGSFAEKNAKFVTEYTYSSMAHALPDDGDGYIPCGFALADVDADGIKEVVVAGRRIVGYGGAIGFFKATAPNTYIDGNVITISQGLGAIFQVGARMGVLERPVAEGGDIVFFNTDENNSIDRRIMMISNVDHISVAGENNFTVLKQFNTASYVGTAIGDQDHGSGSDGFDIYFPKEFSGVYDLEYNGTGNIYDSTNYTLYKIFDYKDHFTGFINRDGKKDWTGIYQIVAPKDDINGNGRKKLITNNQIYMHYGATDTLISNGTIITTQPPFFIIEWGVTGLGLFDVKVVPPIMPEDYILEQNYPNPFNPSTTIRFTMPTPEDISLIIYDINGKEVTRLIDKQRYETGTFEKVWNGKNKDGRNVSSGTYLCKLKWGNFEKSMKMSLVK